MADIKEEIPGLHEKTAGTAPLEANQRPSTAHNNTRSSASNKGNSGTLHWFAYIGNEADSLQNETISSDRDVDSDDAETYDGTSALDFITDPGKENSSSQKEREERIRALRDRQNEERQRKLEELKQQALAAQKFREQKEEERRRRIDELRQRDNDRRHQVEERKRQIWEAERDRREAILRKNQEREARIDSKRKNERSSIVFAFGSSTPRMLEPADTGGSFWGTRRATSTTNVMMFTAAVPLTRRSSERELDGSKKRATSASGLDRKPGEDMKMSSSMYEVFHWISTPEPTSKPTQRAKSHSHAPGSEPKVPPEKSDPQHTAPVVPTELNLNIDERIHSFSSAPQTPSNRSVRIGGILPGYGGFPAGEEGEATSPGTAASLAAQRVNRRKTDLMPTIPSPRDLTPTSSSRPSSVHLQGNRPFNRSPGLRSGEVTPSPPSRPLSALSQQSMNSVNSGVSLRARPVAASRRPRPISIAVTGVTHESDNQATRTSHRHSIAGDIRTSKTQNVNVERESAKPPLPKVHSTKKFKSDVPMKKSTDKVMKSTKASPRITPKATPLQSPGTEALPSLPQDIVERNEDVGTEEQSEIVEKTEEFSLEKLSEKPDVEQIDIAKKESIEDTSSTAKEQEIIELTEIEEQKNTEALQASTLQNGLQDTEKVETLNQTELADSEVDMTASMIAKTRITTEEEAKAALAERRRLAREQAEREAELERQRLEEEKRLEEERLRQEEEDQRKFEEEQLRLVEEARRAEEERLLQAIQENEKREEEERKRREEEAKAKAEKEEAEKKAREEAERLRREMDERLKKEEEERIARRKRVEAIMLRTRGKGSTPSNTPTKGDGENDDGKDDSPMEENKSDLIEEATGSNQTQLQELQQSDLETESSAQLSQSASGDITAGNGQISQVQQNLFMDSFNTNIMDHIQENGGSEKKVSSSSSSDLLLLDSSNNLKPMETSEDLITSATSVLPPPPQLQQSNGHRNGMEYDAVDFVSVDNVKQNNATNNLLDFSEFDTFRTNNVMLNATQQPTAATEFEQILDLGSVPPTRKLSNEDNVNSNVMNNGPAPPFIAFQDNLSKKADTNSVTDLLS